MTHNGFPEHASTTGQFRAEDIAPFIGQKAIVTITPVPAAGTELTSTVAAGIIAGAHRDRHIDPLVPSSYPHIYFQDGFNIAVSHQRTDSQITIALIDALDRRDNTDEGRQADSAEGVVDLL